MMHDVFDNGVWEIETDPQTVDHSRVMKSRFLLTWRPAKGGSCQQTLARCEGKCQCQTDPYRHERDLGASRWVADISTAFFKCYSKRPTHTHTTSTVRSHP